MFTPSKFRSGEVLMAELLTVSKNGDRSTRTWRTSSSFFLLPSSFFLLSPVSSLVSHRLSPEGTGRLLKAGLTISFQMHYTTTGQTVRDRTSIGFVFAKEPPREEIRLAHFANGELLIPPGAPSHRVDSERSFVEDAKLWSIAPHAHLRGKSFEYRLAYPDGREEIVLSLCGCAAVGARHPRGSARAPDASARCSGRDRDAYRWSPSAFADGNRSRGGLERWGHLRAGLTRRSLPCTIRAGDIARLTLTLTEERMGRPLEDLEPYLGRLGPSLRPARVTRRGAPRPSRLLGHDREGTRHRFRRAVSMRRLLPCVGTRKTSRDGADVPVRPDRAAKNPYP
jgi:hypothetical protein